VLPASPSSMQIAKFWKNNQLSEKVKKKRINKNNFSSRMNFFVKKLRLCMEEGGTE